MLFLTLAKMFIIIKEQKYFGTFVLLWLVGASPNFIDVPTFYLIKKGNNYIFLYYPF